MVAGVREFMQKSSFRNEVEEKQKDEEYRMIRSET